MHEVHEVHEMHEAHASQGKWDDFVGCLVMGALRGFLKRNIL